MKTPEQMAEEYDETVWDESELAPEDRAIERHVAIGKHSTKIGFLAGYQAAKDQQFPGAKPDKVLIDEPELVADADKAMSDATLHYQYMDAQTNSSKTPEKLVAIYTDELCEELAKSGINPNKRGAIFRIEDMRMAFLTGCKRAVQPNVDIDTNNIKTINANNLNGWISVKERLPEEGEDVLVFGQYLNDIAKVLGVRSRYRGDQEWKYTWEGPDEWVYRENDVTHWMPLPKPPEDK